jgi:hypothetical protein
MRHHKHHTNSESQSPSLRNTDDRISMEGKVTPSSTTKLSPAVDVVTTAVDTGSTISSSTPNASNSVQLYPPLDFIGNSVSVKDLFVLPYAIDRPIAVAVHNMGGTLLIDTADPHHHSHLPSSHYVSGEQTRHTLPVSSISNTRPQPALLDDSQNQNTNHDESTVDDTTLKADTLISRSLSALSIPNLNTEVLQMKLSLQRQEHMSTQLSPDDYVSQYIPPTNDPREYLSWNFRGLNLLVGSDAIIYRTDTNNHNSENNNSNDIDDYNRSDESTTDPVGTPSQTKDTVQVAKTDTAVAPVSNAIVVRVEDVNHMKSQLQHYNTMRQTGAFIADHQFDKFQQMGKLSYAEVAAASIAAKSNGNKDNRAHLPAGTHYVSKVDTTDEAAMSYTNDSVPQINKATRSFLAPDLDRVQLQTCIVPVPSMNEASSVGSYLSYVQQQQSIANSSRSDSVVSQTSDQPDNDQTGTDTTNTPNSSQPLNPVSTVIDTYLDNIMANVPQLALCLREKGFIQSIKLLNTEEIPSRFLQSSTFNTSIPFETIQGGPSDPADEVFSPQIMEMNAQALLRFLKTNCKKDNATYLLRRDVGHANLQLYDISSISAQRQQKWIWWLAMISYRFSNRLKHLSSHVVTSDPGLRRSFRVRQRSLLHNTLDLLETLADMNGNKHESLIAGVCENLADTYLVIVADTDNHDDGSNISGLQTTNATSPIEPPPQAVSSHQPYGNISVDSLSKAQDHLVYGIKILNTVLQKTLKPITTRKASKKKNRPVKKSGKSGFLSDASDSEEDDDSVSDNVERVVNLDSSDEQIDPVVIQLFGMHQKVVNVSLRLAEIHLKNYWSSSAMQNLRAAGQRMSDSLYLTQLVDHNTGKDTLQWLPKIEVQYAWLWEQCGHFARSFAADIHWRDRGHASGDDVVSVLQDVDAAFADRTEFNVDGPLQLHRFSKPMDSITVKSKGVIGLQSLNGVLPFHRLNIKQKVSTKELKQSSFDAAIQLLDNQKMLQRDERRVLVAAAMAYSRAVNVFDVFSEDLKNLFDKTLVDFLRQRLGDACNEIGKVMLNEVRSLLTSKGSEDEMSTLTAEALCSSAEFWFLEGLHLFEVCHDLRNLALLRCNLCQCYKFRANAAFAQPNNHHNDQDHAESCLQEATNHLHAAHTALEVRDTDPITWDMVSGELAATLLVLGVRRRQSLIGSGNTIMILHALRLSPGKERSIVDPIERALCIYEETGKIGQAAAAHYQLAQFYAKIWTCQRDEAKTREKLAAAFKHYETAHAYFVRNVHGNEATFCLLCLDLASLFASVSGEACLSKALFCCVDTSACFSSDAIDSALSDLSRREEWFPKMDTLAASVDERLFKLLKSLVKIEEDVIVATTSTGNTTKGNDKYKNMYRTGLQSKMTSGTIAIPNLTGDVVLDAIIKRLSALRHILYSVKTLIN